MIRLRYDEDEKVTGLPDSLRLGDNLTFEVTSERYEVSENDDLRLSLALERPIHISVGEWIVTWEGSSTPLLDAAHLDAFALETALNRLDSIISAGGVDVSDDHGRLIVTFRENGSRDDFTLYHSILGSVAGRTSTIVAGNNNHRETDELDFTLQVLAEGTSGTDITGATVSVTNIATGDAATAQRDKVVFSRVPDYGKFQIWTASDAATRWLEPAASSYQIEMALEDIEPGEFIVSRNDTGGQVTIDLRRAAVGVNPAPTVSNTFIGPIGVTIGVDASKAMELLNAMQVDWPNYAVLTFIRDLEKQFSQTVKLEPMLLPHGQPI